MRQPWSTGTLMLAVATALLPAATPTSAEPLWRSGPAHPDGKQAATELLQALRQLSQRESLRRVVIRFERSPVPADRAELAAQGVRLLRWVGGDAYFAALDSAPAVDALVAGGKLRRIDAIDTRWKLHPDLEAGLIRPWSIVRPAMEAAAPRIALYVLFHPDFDGESLASRLVARHGGRLQSHLRSVNGAVIHLGAERLIDFAAEDAVMYVEPPLPMWSELNDLATQVVGATMLNDPPYGLTGAGVTALIYDGGQIFAHDDFGSRLTIGQSDTDGISDHATHVGGTVGGDGTVDSQLKGMAPAVGLVSYGFQQEGGLSMGFLYTDPGDLEADYTEAITLNGADVSNNSIGSNVASNGFPCEWEGDYNVTSALIDAIVGGSLGAPFRIVWASGNERSGAARCGDTYHVIPPPSGAKNHIGVGAVNSDDGQSVTGFTSWGPTDDGRLKPDVVAPGCQANGDGGTTSTSSSGGYNVKCGTSMASPVVTGVAALLLEHHRATFPASPDFRNATLKAILAQTAQDLEEVGPDYKTGYGLVQALPAADLISDGRYGESAVEQDAVATFVVDVAPGLTGLRVTLAWDDPSGVPNSGAALVNDLDLLVSDGAGAVFYPWTLDPGDPASAAVRTRRDATNNLEQVRIDAPVAGTFLIEVHGRRISEGPSQTFSLAASHDLQGCSSAGRLSTASDRLACSDLLGLQLVDCDLDGDSGLAETVGITVTSASEPGGESVLLTENALDSGQFSGALTVDATGGPGVLQVSDGEIVEATYVDADDGDGGTNVPVIRQAVVDCTAPAVLSVAATGLQPTSFSVEVSLDEPARLTLHYGTDCGDLTGVATSNLDDFHSLPLSGLEPLTTYFFTVEVEDDVGNQTLDDNLGACYSATTTIDPDFMTEQFFSVPFDLVGSYMTLIPEQLPLPVYYDRCLGALDGGELPVDPSGGTSIQPAAVDDFTEVTLAGGKTVALYGQSYDTVFISWNGHVVLGLPGAEVSEAPPTDAATFFSKPRIAALTQSFRLPYPATTVSWKQLADRFVVTWDKVLGDGPADYDSAPSTFQVELFFDGRIRISWLAANVAANNRWTGISAGSGEPQDWAEEDLSTTFGCSARPPFAPGQVLATATDTPLGVVLGGSDDALPAPSELTYSITRLPALGTLTDDGTGATIAAVPHELDSAGDGVTYVPQTGHYGDDLFEYTVDDGGAQPDGGASAPGVVRISLGIDTLFEYLVDDTDPGWLLDPLWAFGQPTGAGSDDGEDPTAGATGLNVYGYNLNGDYENDLSAKELHSDPLDLSQVDDTRLEFRRWLNVSGAADTAAVSVDDAPASSGTTVWEVGPYTLRESNWFPTTVDISSIADREAFVRVRWILGPTDGSNQMGGWNVDDIRILGHVVEACSAEPGEAVRLLFAADGATLSWSVAPLFGGETPTYDLLRSTTVADFGAGASCIATDVDTSQVVDATEPPSGSLVTYLVRGRNECGLGSVGLQSSGSPRTAPACP